MKTRNIIKNLLLVLLLAGYTVLCLNLFWTGKITYYVHPSLAILALISGVFLLIVSFLIVLSLGFKNAQGGQSSSLTSSKLKLFLVFLPLVMFVIFQPKVLSSQAFASRSLGVQSDLGLSRQFEKPAEFVINTENRSLIDWIRLFTQNAEPQTYANLKAHLTGFVMRDGTLPANYFTIARFVISCCAADARPVGLVVKYDPAKFNFKTDQWLDIKGTFVVEEINGERINVLNLTEAKPIEVPANPYLS